MRCERCSKKPKDHGLLDYCASCSKNLCPDCMKKGCCGKTPAASGMGEDNADDYISKTTGYIGGSDAGGQAPSSDDAGGSAISGGCDSGGGD